MTDSVAYQGECEGRDGGSIAATLSLDPVAAEVPMTITADDYCRDAVHEDALFSDGEVWNGTASVTLSGEDMVVTFGYKTMSTLDPAVDLEAYDETEVFTGTIVWEGFATKVMMARAAGLVLPPDGTEPTNTVNMVAQFTEGNEPS